MVEKNFSKLEKSFKNGTAETSRKGLNKIAPNRWGIAQVSEKIYWEQYTTDSLLEESKDRFPKKAELLLKYFSKFIDVHENLKILQVGCAAEDVINYFKIGELYSIDPLANFYKEKFKFNYENTNFIQARGEEIPFEDNFFDIVLLTNVLDHCELPDKVLSEICRVLKNNGIFYFENNIYQKRFIQIGKLYGKINNLFTGKIFNIHHPFMFTYQDLKNILSKNFTILQENVGKQVGMYENIGEVRMMLDEYLKNRYEFSFYRKILSKFDLTGDINCIFTCKNNN